MANHVAWKSTNVPSLSNRIPLMSFKLHYLSVVAVAVLRALLPVHGEKMPAGR